MADTSCVWCEKGRSEPRIGYRLLDVATHLQIGRATMRQLWVAAGASTDAVDIVLAKVPLGGKRVYHSKCCRQNRSQRSTSDRERRGNWLFEAEARSFSFGPIVNTEQIGVYSAPMTDQHRHCKCGSVYRRTKSMAPSREVNSFECTVCGTTLESWNTA